MNFGECSVRKSSKIIFVKKTDYHIFAFFFPLYNDHEISHEFKSYWGGDYKEQTCCVEKELFVIPMAAYERALLLIMQHTEVATRESTGTSNFELLLEVWRLWVVFDAKGARLQVSVIKF